MIEIFNGLKLDKINDGPTGPGNQTPIANGVNAGYYGLVPNKDFITPLELLNEVGLTALGYSVRNNDIPWMKFYLDDKILFVPQKQITTVGKISDLYALGLIHGTGDFGPSPWHTGVLQNKTITIKDKQYIVRLFKGSLEQTVPIEGSGYDQLYTHGSEYNRLMYNVSSTNPPSQIGSNWAEFNGLELDDITSYEWCQNHYLYKFGYLLRAVNTVMYSVILTGDYNVGVMGYRPVLELVQ